MGKKNTAILIRPKAPKEQAFIEGLLERLGMVSQSLSEDELLDMGLSRMMRGVDRSKKVDAKTAMKVLAS